MVAVPPETPVTSPVVLTVATAVALLLHVPPPVVLVSVILLPAHTDEGPEIALTEGLTLTVTERVAVAVQPVPTV